MAAPMRVVGLDRFISAMRQLETVAPREVDDLLAEVMEQDILPGIQAQTPVGDGRSGPPGRLRASTKVSRGMGRPSFVNTKVYANTIHWGRVKRGRVVGRKFIWDAAKDARPVIEAKVGAGLGRLLDKHLP